MLNIETLEKINQDFERRMIELEGYEYGAENGHQLIIDGVVDAKHYLKAPAKIVWVLREAYDKHKGGWHYAKNFLAEEDAIKRIQEGGAYPTWYPVLQIAKAVLQDLRYTDKSDLPQVASDPEMTDILRSLCILNVSKLAGATSSKDAFIQSQFEKNKELLVDQILAHEANVVFCGGTFDHFVSHLDIDPSQITKKFEPVSFFFWNEIKFVGSYHPSHRGVKLRYVNAMIDSYRE